MNEYVTRVLSVQLTSSSSELSSLSLSLPSAPSPRFRRRRLRLLRRRRGLCDTIKMKDLNTEGKCDVSGCAPAVFVISIFVIVATSLVVDHDSFNRHIALVPLAHARQNVLAHAVLVVPVEPKVEILKYHTTIQLLDIFLLGEFFDVELPRCVRLDDLDVVV